MKGMTKAKKIVLAVISLAVATVLTVGIWLGATQNSRGGMGGVLEEETGGGMILPEEVTEDNIALMSMQIPAAQYDEYGVAPMAETAYTVTATVKDKAGRDPLPEEQQRFKWSMAWATENEEDVNTYVSMAESGGKTATFTCLKGFSTKITVTCAWEYDESVKSTLPLDYAKRLSGLKVSYAKSLTDSASGAYLTETTATAAGAEFTLHIPNQTTVGTTTGEGNWSSKIIGIDANSGTQWGEEGTVANTVTGITGKIYVKVVHGSGGSFFANMASASSSENALAFSSKAYEAGTWSFFKSLFRSGVDESLVNEYIGSSVSDRQKVKLDYCNALYTNLCSDSGNLAVRIVIDLTVNLQYGDPVAIPLTIKLESEALTAGSIELSPSGGHIF